MRISVAIVEDDASAAQALEHHLARFAQESGDSFVTARFSEAGSFLQNYQPRYDLIFMDIKMPGLDGMSAAEQLRQVDPVTMLIFVTSMVQYAVQGYDVNAFDFIVKPVNPTAFDMKLRRAVRALKLAKGTELVLNTGGITRVLPSSAIHYIEVLDHDLTYHTEQGAFSVRGKLSCVLFPVQRVLSHQPAVCHPVYRGPGVRSWGVAAGEPFQKAGVGHGGGRLPGTRGVGHGHRIAQL